MHKSIDEQFKRNKLSKEDKKELKARGIKLNDKNAIKAYFEEKAREKAEKDEAERLAAEEAARIERENNPTTEDLLKQILAELKAKKDY